MHNSTRWPKQTYALFIPKLIQFLINFLLVQLFINLLTWPLFLYWGLPITPLSIVGNLMFSPFLTFFLIVSSLAVTCELLLMPNQIFFSLLELITKLWLWIIRLPTPDCMMTFITPPLILSLLAPLMATFIILSKKIKTKTQKIGALLCCYTLLMLLFSWHPKPTSIEVPYGTHTVTLRNDAGMLSLFDGGFSRRKSSINQWINYTLLPQLGKTFGRQTIDTVIIKKKSPSTELFAESLKQRARVKTIIFEDERAKTTPSFHAVPLRPSKSPSFQNLSTPQSQEFLNAVTE